MKKLFILLFITLSFFNPTYANEENEIIMVEVTEKIPWLDCTTTNKDGADCTEENIKNKNCITKCPVKKWVASFTDILGTIIRYITFLVGLAGVLYIIINGILYSMGWVEQGMKDEAKKRIVQGLIGIVLLLLSGFILNLIAPWVYTAP